KRRLEFDVEFSRVLGAVTANKTNETRLQTGEHVARHTFTSAPDLARGASSPSARALLFGAILLASALAGFFALSSLRPQAGTPPAGRAAERQIGYSLTVQRMRDGRPYQKPFESTGQEIFESGWKFKLNFSAPESGYVYLLNEGPTEGGAISYSLL